MTSVLPREMMLDLFGGIRTSKSANFLDAKVEVRATKVLEVRSPERLHFHEHAHLNFVVSGGLVVKRKNSESERQSGDLVFCHSGEPHQTLYQTFPGINLNIEINEKLFADKAFGETCRIESLAKNLNSKFVALKIYKELLNQDEFSDSSIEMLLLNMFSGETSDFRPSWLDKVIELLNDNWNEPISLQDLAKAANVYPTTISKHFPKYLSCTLGEYRRRLKVEKSLGIIKNSNHSLTEIAYQCGFADQSHFTRTFKQLTGFLPRQYESL